MKWYLRLALALAALVFGIVVPMWQLFINHQY